MGVFGVFFAKAVGLSLSQLGVISGVSAIVSAGLLFPCGFLGDKFHPIRTMLTAVVAQAVLSALPLVFLIFRISPDAAFQVWCIVFGVSVPVMALFLASELPTYMKILPHEKFGQFASAAALVRSLFTMCAGLTLGLLIDWTKTTLSDPNTAYLFLPLWPTVLQAMSAFCLWMCFLQWKRLGGDTSYSPP